MQAMCALLREREAASAETVAGDSRLAAALAPALAELTALRGTVEGLQQEVYSKVRVLLNNRVIDIAVQRDSQVERR
jgi:alkylation response protein AidB-like acyl-CoA dehydrogenase